MSFKAFEKDLKWGEKKEQIIKAYYEEQGYEVKATSQTDVLDFLITKNKESLHIEVKSRRCSSTDYPDTMIGVNKLAEAYTRWNKDGTETRFVFLFTDGIFEINPFTTMFSSYDYRAGRRDRGNFDGKKGWIYYKIN